MSNGSDGYGVFGVDKSPLFDEVRHTQGGMPHLMQYLWAAYVRDLEGKIAGRVARGEKAVPLAEAIRKAPAVHFLEFATGFLAEVRVADNFFVDENHGIRLTNGDMAVVCPGTRIQGTMQQSHSVQINSDGRDGEGEGDRQDYIGVF